MAQNPATSAEALSVASVAAVTAATARTDARHQDPVTRCDGAHRRTDRGNRAHCLVAEYPAPCHLWHIAFEDVQIGTTDGDCIDTDHDVGVVDDPRLGNLGPGWSSRTVIDQRLHALSSCYRRILESSCTAGVWRSGRVAPLMVTKDPSAVRTMTFGPMANRVPAMGLVRAQ